MILKAALDKVKENVKVQVVSMDVDYCEGEILFVGKNEDVGEELKGRELVEHSRNSEFYADVLIVFVKDETWYG